MLEIVKKDGTPDKEKFALEMVNLQIEIVNKINEICEKYHLNPFETIKTFGVHLLQGGADLQAKFNAEFGKDDNEENEGGKS